MTKGCRQRVWAAGVAAILVAGPAVAQQSSSHAVISMSVGDGEDGQVRIRATEVRDGVTNTTTVVTNVVGQGHSFTFGSGGSATNSPWRAAASRWMPAGAQATAAASPSPWLGVAVQEASAMLRAQIALDPGVGLVVTLVSEDSPALKAGVQLYDILTRFDDQILTHPSQLRALVQQKKEGDRVVLKAVRQGKEVECMAVIAMHAPAPEESLWGGGFDGAAIQNDIREWLQSYRAGDGQNTFVLRRSGGQGGSARGGYVATTEAMKMESLVRRLRTLAAQNRDEVLNQLENLVDELSQPAAEKP